VRVKLEATFIDPLEAQLEPPAPGRLSVGLVIPQSGPLGLTGPSALDAALLAAHEVNTSGGVHGQPVELVLVDGGRAPALVAAEVGRLARSGVVDTLVGFHTSDVHRAIEVEVAGRTPYVFTPPHEGGRRLPGVACLGTDPSQQLRGPLAWLTRHHHLRRWALVGNDYIWPHSVHRHARRLVHAQGASVVLEAQVPLGGLAVRLDRLLEDLRTSGADAVLLSLVGRDLATFNSAARATGLDQRLVRLSGALEENGLLASDGDRTGTLYAAMSSFTSLTDEGHLGLAARHSALFGPQAPVLDSYAEGVYDGVRAVAALARRDALHPETLADALPTVADPRRRQRVHLARADAFAFEVVPAAARDASIWK
jgi:ABC-type branched-subunit amino acid transport system substrate-binding protein